MAAPTGPQVVTPTTGQPIDDEILSRLTAIVDDVDPAAASEEDAPETKETVAVETPEGDDEPIAADAGEEEIEVSASEDATGAEQGEDEVNTMADLAKMFDVDEVELLTHLQVDNGKGEQVPLARVIETYRKAPESVLQFDKLQAREQEFEAETVQYRTRADEQLKAMVAQTQSLIDTNNEEFANIDWARLQVEDASQYLILKERHRERAGKIQATLDQMKKVDEGRNAELAAAAARNRSHEISKLHAAMPDWVDPKIANVAMQETNAYLLEIGYDQEKINKIIDHRDLLVAHEASQYRKLQKQAPQKIEKLRSLPGTKSVLRSTARRDTASAAQKNARKNMDRLRKTGDERDAARIFEELL
jgi:hypothetical protein